MRNSIPMLVICILALVLYTTGPVSGQQGASAGVYGSVYDAQGAVVPGASVRLLQVATHQTRTVATDQAGEYRFALLPVGEYRLMVEQPGFKKYEQTGLLLQVNGNVKVDVRLEVVNFKAP